MTAASPAGGLATLLKCTGCGAVNSSKAKSCLKCGASQPSRPEAAPKPIGTTSNLLFAKLRVRYLDAYAVARGLVTTGGIIKSAGLVIGSILSLVGIVCFFRNRGMTGPIEGILFILVGALTAGGGLIAGKLIAAVGQLMSAGIDTAVNTSENISTNEKAEILGLCCLPGYTVTI